MYHSRCKPRKKACVAFLAVLVAAGSAAAQEMVKDDNTSVRKSTPPDFTQLIPTVIPKSAIFEMDDWNIWGADMVRTDDGVCHLLFSRWPKTFGHDAWVTHSEIAHATADQPEGPYTFQNVVLPARGVEYWDGHMTHNPSVIAYKGKFYLYYTANRGPEGWSKDKQVANYGRWTHRMNMRIGVAVADHPGGPWKRFDKPLLDVPDFGSGIVATPSALVKPDGGILLYFKTQLPGEGRFGGGIFHYAAISDHPLGPFEKYDKPMVDKRKQFNRHFDFHIDDHFQWYQDGKYYAIVKDHDQPFLSEHGRCLYLLESENGLDWRKTLNDLVTKFRITWDDQTTQAFSRLEMPKLYIENGKPKVLFLAALPVGSQDSFNIAIKLLAEDR